MSIDWYGLSEKELSLVLTDLGEKAFRAKQIFSWLHEKRAVSFDEMTNLSIALRAKLNELSPLTPVEAALVQRSSQKELGKTAKYLMRLPDGKCMETVLMEYSYGYSVCVSSQVGCRMGCRFCASTLNGLDRNLLPGEMLGQIYAVEREEGIRVNHIVVMGSGEPFDNYDNLMRFLTLLHDPDGANLSYRNMTVSTCGLTDKIRAFADSGLPVTLAVSLHAPEWELRKSIMNIARAVTMPELMDACRYYTETTNRRISFEYALMDGINCEVKHAEQLAALLGNLLCHVNLIPVNPVPECGMSRPSAAKIRAFTETLEAHHIPVTLRREMASDIDGACGQLRARHGDM